MSLSFINHADDFDVVTNVAVEFVRNRHRVCVVGAQLGNIAGVGQTRVSIAREADIPMAADTKVREMASVGTALLQRFSSPSEALAVLRRGGQEADLISPIRRNHELQIHALSEIENAT